MNIEDAYGIFICSNQHIKGCRFFITYSPFFICFNFQNPEEKNVVKL